MQESFKKFQESFDGELHLDELHRMIYATDASVYRMLPMAVALPFSERGIIQLIRFASENELSLIPRAAGTSLAGQCVGNGIVVDVSKHFSKIISLNTAEATVCVQPGVVRDELNAYLKEEGLFFGPNTSTSNRCMIGGMVGNNSSGTTSIKYGVTSDKVESLRVVLSDGSVCVFSEMSSAEFERKMEQTDLEGQIYRKIHELLRPKEVQEEIRREFPKKDIHRRNTGYAVDLLLESAVFGGEAPIINLSKLLCGSEGTLAFVTEITLKLDSLPPAYEMMVVAQYESLEASLEDVQVLMQHPLYSCEMLDDHILNLTKYNRKYDAYRFFIEGQPKTILLLELRANSRSELESQAQKLLRTLKHSKRSYAQTKIEGVEIGMVMELRKGGLGILGNMIGDRKAVACIEDTAVSLEDLPAYILEFTTLMKKHGQEAVYYAHAGAGELHLRPILNLKTKEGVEAFRSISTEVAALCKRYGGSFSGEHGDGIVRAEFLESQIGTKNFQLLKEIKTVFDPANIFNPGKITDAWPMDQNLRTKIDQPESEIPTEIDFSAVGGIIRFAEKCNGSGDCRKSAEMDGTMCPSYQATKNEKDSTRARANVLREVLTTKSIEGFAASELKEVMDLCLGCKACATECPSSVDIALAKAEATFQYHKTHPRSKADTFFGKSSVYHRRARRFPKLVNAILGIANSSSWLKSYVGMAAKRSFPKYSTKSLNSISQKSINQENNTNKLYLFIDEFSRYLEADLSEDVIELLGRLGFQVTPVLHLDSARALLSKGFLEEAKKEIDANVTYFKDLVSAEAPLVGIEPSAILGFRDEYPKLASMPTAAEEIAKHVFTFEEFIATKISEGTIIPEQFTEDSLELKIHNHCHQKALSNQKYTFDMLNLPLNFKPTIITSGCCGMAGSFGYEKQHYDLSMQIGELKLFPAVRRASKETIVVASGTSCRQQILDGTGVKALHPATVLLKVLK